MARIELDKVSLTFHVRQDSKGLTWKDWVLGLFRRRRRMHDPMLVLNMSIFNVGNGWDRIFNPLKAYENGTR